MARRLRIPKVLAVALLGSSATVAVAFSGCEVPQKNINPSAMVPDASGVDSASVDGDDAPDGELADAMADAHPDAAPDAMIDAMVDARPDAPPDARPDARPDAPMT